MQTLVTGASGFVGSALIPALEHDGHDVRAFARDATRVQAQVPVAEGDVLTGAGLGAALDGVEVAYYLVHSMEAGDTSFSDRELRSAENFAAAADAAGVRRVVYLGGLVPADGNASAHLASRLAVEETLLDAGADSVALRASIVIAARSRSFRFIVRLIERLPALGLPPWRNNRTQPIDGRDMIEFLVRAARSQAAGGRSIDVAGPDVLSYGEMIERISEHMLLGRPRVALPAVAESAVAGRLAAALGGEDPELIGPLLEGLQHDLLPRDDAAALLGVRLHSFDHAVERALRDWEADEVLVAR